MVRVAAFDLDGTILDGESPLKLTTSLLRHRELPIYKGLAMGIWGIRYRLRLPQVESTPRELLFSALTEPTVEEVEAHIKEKGYDFDAESFVAYYDSNGWMVGKKPMKNWKAACITWQRNGYSKKEEKQTEFYW